MQAEDTNLLRLVGMQCGRLQVRTQYPLSIKTNMSSRAAGAVAVTVPACWYLISTAPDTSHHGGDHGGDHGDDHGKSHDEDDEESEDEGEDQPKNTEEKDDSDTEKSEDSDSGDKGKGADTPDTSDDEGKGETKKAAADVKFKGSTKEGEAPDSREHVPDAKGGAKKRINSDKAIKLGGDEEATDGDSSEEKDKVRKTSF